MLGRGTVHRFDFFEQDLRHLQFQFAREFVLRFDDPLKLSAALVECSAEAPGIARRHRRVGPGAHAAVRSFSRAVTVSSTLFRTNVTTLSTSLSESFRSGHSFMASAINAHET